MPWSLCPNFLTLFTSPKQPLTVSIHLSLLCERDGNNMDLYDWLLLLNIFKIMILFYMSGFHPLWLPNSIPLSGYTTFWFVFISVCEGVVQEGRETAYVKAHAAAHRWESNSAAIPRLPSCLRHGLSSAALCDRRAGWRLVRTVLPQPPISTQAQRSQTCYIWPALHTSGNLNLGPQMWASGAYPLSALPSLCQPAFAYHRWWTFGPLPFWGNEWHKVLGSTPNTEETCWGSASQEAGTGGTEVQEHPLLQMESGPAPARNCLK